MLAGEHLVDDLDGDVVLPTASVGKVFLLLAVLDDVEHGRLDPAEMLTLDAADAVGDSGLLQFLDRRSMSVLDLCRFVAAVSDNFATNVLIRRVGLDRVAAATALAGIGQCALHDVVRDERGPGDPPFLSTGSAAELAALVRGLALGTSTTARSVSRGTADLLRLNTDLSMVASAFGVDPLAHTDEDLGIRLFNKTGSDSGTRADIGWVGTGEGSGLAYAVIARFDDSPEVRRVVLDAMRAVGASIDPGR